MYKLNYFNFSKRNNNYLLTNDFGKYIFLSPEQFNKLIHKQPLDLNIEKELLEKGFIYKVDEEIFAMNNAGTYRNMKGYLLYGPSLHIFVVTKNCNFNCIYCQAGNLNQNEDYYMTEEVAKKAVDIALESTSKYLTFEFQGGEPLLNFDVIKFIVEYSKENSQDKIIEYNLVSNLTMITDEMIDYFIKNNVNICTSIDGNKELQNINRPYKNKDSYTETINKINEIKKLKAKVNAIETTTRYSLSEYKTVIDEYINLGMESIFLRPLTKLGKADKSWKKIGYSVNEYLKFYKNALDYIIQKNKEGSFIIESYASIFLKKILFNKADNYMELRSPCGAAIGQIAYYYDGNIFTCDEGRMFFEMGDDSFKIGNVFENSYKDLMESDVTKAISISSCLETLPYCKDCVYMPYCGVCPVINLGQEGNIFSKDKNNFRCKINQGILDILFGYIEKNDYEMDIFKGWIEKNA